MKTYSNHARHRLSSTQFCEWLTDIQGRELEPRKQIEDKNIAELNKIEFT
jgi:hypothetical protein